MAEENILDTNESKLGTVIIGMLLIIAGFMVYNYFQGEPKVVEDISESETAESSENASEVESGEGLGASTGIYKVQEGDNLWKIAEKFYDDGFRWREIAGANSIPESEPTVELGQELIIPSEQGVTGEEGESIEEGVYLVKQGDSLWRIAEEKLGRGSAWKELARVNQIPEENPTITVGQSLIVSGFGGPETGDVLSSITAEKVDNEVKVTEMYTVESGDTLWGIAEKFYGDGILWNKIYDSSENNLSMYSPKTGSSYPLVHAGNVLVIPE